MYLRMILFISVCLFASCGGDSSNNSGCDAKSQCVRLANSRCQAPALDTVGGDYFFSLAFLDLPASPQPIAMKQLPVNNGGWLLAQREARMASFENDAAANSNRSTNTILA
ncbi:MAG: hypothetical protein ACJAUP_003846 [Cellvibrionaceae bacterium]|jgi:hypothetical protein